MLNQRIVALTLKVVCALGVLCILVFLWNTQLHGHVLSTSTSSSGANLAPKPLEVNTTPWFTAEELDYVRYGEGAVPLVQPRDPRYLNFIRSQIARPAMNKPTLVANVNDGHLNSIILDHFKGKTSGFFIECGANDGEFQSNTMYLESKMGWTGLLVEASPVLARKLLARNRKAFVYGGCLSPQKRPAVLRFKTAKCCGGLVDHLNTFQEYLIQLYSKDDTVIDQVQCYPLGDLMAAIGVNHVDYMSLDVQGAEIPILKSIDFHELRIDLLTIECADNNATIRQQMADEIVNLFAATGLYEKIEIGTGDLVVKRRANATMKHA